MFLTKQNLGNSSVHNNFLKDNKNPNIFAPDKWKKISLKRKKTKKPIIME